MTTNNKFTVTESVNGIDMTLGPFLTAETANQARRYLLALEKLSAVDDRKIKAKAKKEELRIARANIQAAKDEHWTFVLEERAEKKAAKDKITQEKLAKKKAKQDYEIEMAEKRKTFAEKNGLR